MFPRVGGQPRTYPPRLYVRPRTNFGHIPVAIAVVEQSEDWPLLNRIIVGRRFHGRIIRELITLHQGRRRSKRWSGARKCPPEEYRIYRSHVTKPKLRVAYNCMIVTSEDYKFLNVHHKLLIAVCRALECAHRHGTARYFTSPWSTSRRSTTSGVPSPFPRQPLPGGVAAVPQGALPRSPRSRQFLEQR